MLLEGGKLLKHKKKIRRVRGAYMLLKAYDSTPLRFKTLIAACKATNRLAADSADKQDIKRWGQKGWDLAKILIRRWPQRAEGYFWTAINLGQYARGGGVWVAMTQGLAGKIEKNAKESLKRDRKLYRGGAQRILGRFYYSVPWPLRKLKKSESYLREAMRLAPKDAGGIMFLGDTLWALGQKAEARKLYQRCASLLEPDLEPNTAPRRCQKKLRDRR